MIATPCKGRRQVRGTAAALALAAAMLWWGGGRGVVAHAQAPFEMPPVLPARELASPCLHQGPTCTVDPQVPVVGFAERPDLQGTAGSLWITGRMSPEAHRQFAALGWTAYQRVLPPWPL
jgi:hypothetical protein